MARSRVALLWAFAIYGALGTLWACAPQGEVGSIACPKIPEYSRADQSRIADELHALPQDDPLVRYANDAERLRVEMRACRSSRI